jgi:arylsulfatase
LLIVVELAGVDYPVEFQRLKVEPMRSRSTVGLLDGTEEAIYGAPEFVRGKTVGGKWMRQGDFKTVMIPTPYGTGGWQLLDLFQDPRKAQDLSKVQAIAAERVVGPPGFRGDQRRGQQTT